MPAGSGRCAEHPSRPAAAACVSCGRPRCGKDVDGAEPSACGICRGGAADRGERDAVRLLRAAAVLVGSVPVCGALITQYVGAGAYAVLVPALCGGVLAELARRSVGRSPLSRWSTLAALWLLAGGAAVLASAAGLAFTPGRASLLTPAERVLPPYAAAALTALAWSLTSPTPRVATCGTQGLTERMSGRAAEQAGPTA